MPKRNVVKQCVYKEVKGCKLAECKMRRSEKEIRVGSD
jgi:hypothetical protein